VCVFVLCFAGNSLKILCFVDERRPVRVKGSRVRVDD